MIYSVFFVYPHARIKGIGAIWMLLACKLYSNWGTSWGRFGGRAEEIEEIFIDLFIGYAAVRSENKGSEVKR